MVIGEIIGSVFPSLYIVYTVGESLYNFCKGNKNKAFRKNSMIGLGTITMGAAIGVGFSAAVNFLLPGAMSEMISTTFTGLAIGSVATPISFLTTNFIQKKVSSRVLDIEVQEHFPLQAWPA